MVLLARIRVLRLRFKLIQLLLPRLLLPVGPAVQQVVLLEEGRVHQGVPLESHPAQEVALGRASSGVNEAAHDGASGAKVVVVQLDPQLHRVQVLGNGEEKELPVPLGVERVADRWGASDFLAPPVDHGVRIAQTHPVGLGQVVGADNLQADDVVGQAEVELVDHGEEGRLDGRVCRDEDLALDRDLLVRDAHPSLQLLLHHRLVVRLEDLVAVQEDLAEELVFAHRVLVVNGNAELGGAERVALHRQSDVLGAVGELRVLVVVHYLRLEDLLAAEPDLDVRVAPAAHSENGGVGLREPQGLLDVEVEPLPGLPAVGIVVVGPPDSVIDEHLVPLSAEVQRERALDELLRLRVLAHALLEDVVLLVLLEHGLLEEVPLEDELPEKISHVPADLERLLVVHLELQMVQLPCAVLAEGQEAASVLPLGIAVVVDCLRPEDLPVVPHHPDVRI